MESEATGRDEIARQRENWRTPIALTAGFAALDLWVDMLGHSQATAPAQSVLQSALTNGRMVWLVGLVIICALIVALPKQSARAAKRADAPIAALAAIGAVAYTLNGLYGPESALFGVAVLYLAGLGYAWFEVRLIVETVHIERFVDAVWVIAASRILKTLLEPAFGALPNLLQAALIPCLPLIVFTTLLPLRKEKEPDIIRATERVRIPLSKGSQIVVAMMVLACPISMAVARSFSSLAFWGETRIIDGSSFMTAVLSSFIFFCCITTVFTRCPDSKEIIRRFVIAIVVLVGFVMFFEPGRLQALGVPEMIGDSFATASELLSHVLFWLSAVAAIRMVDWHPYRLAAMTELVMSSLGVVLGLLMQASQQATGYILEILLYALMVCAVALAWRVQGSAPAIAEAESLDRVCARIAAEHNLTQRETEVFTLLAQGRSRTFIQSELFLADSTVKTYTNHIYRKLDIHSKQDLISLVRQADGPSSK